MRKADRAHSSLRRTLAGIAPAIFGEPVGYAAEMLGDLGEEFKVKAGVILRSLKNGHDGFRRGLGGAAAKR